LSVALAAGCAASNSRAEEGVLEKPVIQRVIRENYRPFRNCYEAGLLRNPDLRGQVLTRFVITESGTATDAEDAGSDLPDPEVIACFLRNFNGMEFPPPRGGKVTVVYPIRLDHD
jgi:hypothetical protein